MAQAEGNPAKTLPLLEEAISVATKAGIRFGIAGRLEGLGEVAKAKWARAA